MRCTIRMVQACTMAAAALMLVAGTATGADTLQVRGGEVSVICPLTVGGSFEAKTDVVKGEVTVASPDEPLDGALLVDLQSLETGIGLRDRHMRNNYLEVEKGAEYAAARLEEIRVERLAGKTTFRGLLTLHGERREVSGTADIKPTASGYRVDASFPVRMSEFRIPDATYLGVGVKNEVQVRVNFTAARPPATGSR